jgi:hypothetical protein
MLIVCRWIVDLLNENEEARCMGESLKRFWDSPTPQNLADLLDLELQLGDEFWQG